MNILNYGCICFCILSVFEPNLIKNSVAGQNDTTTRTSITTATADTTTRTATADTTTRTATAADTTTRIATAADTTTRTSITTATADTTTRTATAADTTTRTATADTTTRTATAADTTTRIATADTITTTTATAGPNVLPTITTPDQATVSTVVEIPSTAAHDDITTTSVAVGNHIEEIQSASTSVESTTISSTAAAASTTEYTIEIDKLIHNKVQELEKSIEEAENSLNELNRTLDHLIELRFNLNHMEADIDEKIFQDTKMLREVEEKISNLRIIEMELEKKERDLLVLKGQQILLEQKIDEDLKFYNNSAIRPELGSISFFAQRNSSFHHHMSLLIDGNENGRNFHFTLNDNPTTIRPYEINPLNEGQSFDKNSGTFTVPFDGIYHFYFTALKMKWQVSGTSRATLQIVKKTNIHLTHLTYYYKRIILEEAHVDSADSYGWFPLQLQTTVKLKAKDEITIELLTGAIYESGSLDHILTSFGGFLICRF